MCGRYALFPTNEEFASLFGFSSADPALPAPRWNIAPGQVAPVMRPGESAGWSVTYARWGLVPAWADGSTFSAKTINARAETAQTRPAFREAAARGRCVVPASGFYEWSGPKHRRLPWFLSRGKDAAVMLMAGLFVPRRRQEGEDGADAGEGRDAHAARPAAPAEEGTFAIVTIPARGAAATIHTRMPAILSPVHAAAWCRGDPAQVALIDQLAIDEIELRRASPRVNAVRSEGKTLLDAEDGHGPAGGGPGRDQDAAERDSAGPQEPTLFG